jgi:hypothetical protein
MGKISLRLEIVMSRFDTRITVELTYDSFRKTNDGP